MAEHTLHTAYCFLGFWAQVRISGWMGRIGFHHLPDEPYARSLQVQGACALRFFIIQHNKGVKMNLRFKSRCSSSITRDLRRRKISQISIRWQSTIIIIIIELSVPYNSMFNMQTGQFSVLLGRKWRVFITLTWIELLHPKWKPTLYIILM